MKQPLALLFYESLLPGSQLGSKLQDLGYRVQTVSDPRRLQECAIREKPIVILVDLLSQTTNVCIEIKGLKFNSATEHIPVIAFTVQNNLELQNAAANAGASLVASDVALLAHLPQLLDQALQVD